MFDSNSLDPELRAKLHDPFAKLSNAEWYALQLAIGNARFGSECKHVHVKQGICQACLRRVVHAPATR